MANPQNHVPYLRKYFLDPRETGKTKIEVYPNICEEYNGNSIVPEHAAYLSGPYSFHKRFQRRNW